MKKCLAVSGGIATLVLLLAVAAFSAGARLSGQGLSLPDGQLFGFSLGGRGGCTDITRITATQLPGAPMMRRAVLVRRQGNSLFIGGPLRNVSAGAGGAVSQADGFDGPVVEVVVTHDTRVYQDVTFENYDGQCGQIRQVVRPGSLDDIVDGTTFLVWGQQTGERILASSLVYELPLLTKPGVRP